jgi:cytochrome P450
MFKFKMLRDIFIGLGLAGVAYIIYKLLHGLLTARQHASKRRELKCEEPPLQANCLPLGIDQIRRALKADTEKLFPTDAIQRTVDNRSITFKYSILGSSAYFTADEKNIQAILATQFSDFEIGSTRRGNLFPLLGNGIFTQDGKSWENSRAMMRPQFARDQVSDLDLEERHVQNMMRALPVHYNGWTSRVDLSVLFFRLTLDSATEFLFGESINSQITLLSTAPNSDPSLNITSNFASAFDVGQAALAQRARFGDQYWLLTTAQFRQACKDCHVFIDHFVHLALSKTRQKEEKDQENENSPAELEKAPKKKYVFSEALARETQDPVELRSQLLHVLLAGRDTTASLLGWLFYSLARDPTRYAKLRSIILAEFGTYEEATTNPSRITFAHLKSCSYLRHSISESLRLFPVVPINSRRATRDTTLPRGGGASGTSPIFVPKGTQVDYSVHVLHHRRDIWGEDVEEFRPERWEGRKVGWEFLPFNGGPRICIGQQFALTEASYVAVRMIQRFERLQNLDRLVGVDGRRHNLTLTNCSGTGVVVKLLEG